MQWYYTSDGEQKGPVDEEGFRKLIAQNVIRPDTLVWREGFGSWEPWGKLSEEDQHDVVDPQSALCVECGRRFLPEQMIRFGDNNVCAQCKPVFFQKMREGVALSGTFVYGGFWIRGLALIVDGIILFPVNLLLNLMAGVMTGAPGPAHDMGMHVAAAGLPMLLNLALACAYDTWFVGRFAATPGKMLCGLRVVRPDGERVSYARALGRHFAEMLSAYILLIGYIMAAFDGEKRSLHDHICDTRVVRK